MHHRFHSETPSEDGDSQLPHSSGSFLDMLYGDNEGSYAHTKFPNTKTIQGDANMPQGYASEDKESAPPSKKHLRAAKQKMKNKKKGGTKSKNPTHKNESSDEEEANKRGLTWKEHWIVNLIHLCGKMHNKFNGMKKQGNFTHILHYLNYYHLFIYGIMFYANYEISLIFIFLRCGQLGCPTHSPCCCLSRFQSE